MEFRQSNRSVAFQVLFLTAIGIVLAFTPFKWIGVIVCATLIFNIVVNARNEKLIVSNGYVRHHQGVINTKTTELALNKIETIETKQSGRNAGTVIISTGDKKRIIFRAVDNPDEVRDYINEQRMKKGLDHEV